MKLLLLPLLLVGAGAGWYGLGSASADDSHASPQGDCRVTVECTERGTCLITCFEPNGDVRCQEEVECDEPCAKECTQPCDAAAAKSAPRTCGTGPACAR